MAVLLRFEVENLVLGLKSIKLYLTGALEEQRDDK